MFILGGVNEETRLCWSVNGVELDHMRPVPLLIAAGIGTFGPRRVFPLPPLSVKSFLVTKHDKLNKECKCFLCFHNNSIVTKQTWMVMSE